MAVTKLGAKAIGDVVNILIDGSPVSFIVTGNPDSNVGVTMQYIQKMTAWQDEYKEELTDFYNTVDPTLQDYLIPSKFDDAATKTARCFLLAYQYMWEDEEKYPGWPYFRTQSNRVATFNGIAEPWWTSSWNSYNGGMAVKVDGSNRLEQDTNWNMLAGFRPSMVLSPELYVLDDGTVSVDAPPEAPASITVPELVKGGGELLVSWAAAADPDGDPVSYELERKTDAADWAQIYQGEALSFTDRIAKGWQTVQYRVRAVDSGNLSSGWTESETRTVDNNTAPAIECEHPGGGDLGEKAEPFAVNYTVTDPDPEDQNALTVTETVDGQTTRTETEAESGAAFEAAVLGDPAEFQKILNGPHTLTITASDGKAQTTHTLTFTKKVTSASVTLSEPLAVEGDITLAALRVAGSIPADALFTVEVTNNGADDQPVWQDATDEVKRGANIVFTNHTAAKGAAFNFRLSVSRGPSDTGGYISAITGAFQ